MVFLLLLMEKSTPRDLEGAASLVTLTLTFTGQDFKQNLVESYLCMLFCVLIIDYNSKFTFHILGNFLSVKLFFGHEL